MWLRLLGWLGWLDATRKSKSIQWQSTIFSKYFETFCISIDGNTVKMYYKIRTHEVSFCEREMNDVESIG